MRRSAPRSDANDSIRFAISLLTDQEKWVVSDRGTIPVRSFEESGKRIGGVVRETSESDRLFTRGTRRVAEEIRQVSERRVKKRVKNKRERKKKGGGKKRREKKSKAPVESARSVGIARWTEPLAYEPKCARSHARISRTVVVRGQAPPPHLSSSGLGRRAAHRVSSRAEPSRVGQYSGQRGGESTRPRSPRTRARRHSEAATTLSLSLSSLLALRRRRFVSSFHR